MFFFFFNFTTAIIEKIKSDFLPIFLDNAFKESDITNVDTKSTYP